MKLCRYQRRKQ